MAERYFTPDEVAKRWNITAGTIRAILRTNQMRGMRVCSAWRIPESAVQEYEETHTTALVHREPLNQRPKHIVTKIV